ncbi:MAG: indolepyruvate ferredoxin oxidoreductase subunit alpha [Nitrospirae bacterium]|nr:indolepyruvate ferredoxin oxidoreductase subunit alpha [Nitrospirota bacterium]
MAIELREFEEKRGLVGGEVLFDKSPEKLLFQEEGRFFGGGAIVVVKALLESGISYFTSFPGSPTSAVTNVVHRVKQRLADRGVVIEESNNEASAAAALRASISSRIRGAVAFKVLGLNFAADIVAHVASAGVTGGAVILVGEDYGCNNTIVAEKTLSYAHQFGLPLLDPGASLQHVSECIKTAFQLSEAAGTPVIVLVRARLGYMTGVVKAERNRFPRSPEIRRELYEKIPLPPYTQRQEFEKFTVRLPGAVEFIRRNQLNPVMGFSNGNGRVGIITHGILTNVVLRAMEDLGIRCPVLSLHALFPLVEDEIWDFLEGKERVLIIEEGMPNLVEKDIRTAAQVKGIRTRLVGKEMVPEIGEIHPEHVRRALTEFFRIEPRPPEEVRSPLPVPERVPTFCTGCPERPIFSAVKIFRRRHPEARFIYSSDLGCYMLGNVAPFNLRAEITGMGSGLANAGALGKLAGARTISFMGDGTFWHSGLTTSVAHSLQNHHDGILVLFYNHFTAMTGHQPNASTPPVVRPSSSPVGRNGR